MAAMIRLAFLVAPLAMGIQVTNSKDMKKKEKKLMDSKLMEKKEKQQTWRSYTNEIGSLVGGKTLYKNEVGSLSEDEQTKQEVSKSNQGDIALLDTRAIGGVNASSIVDEIGVEQMENNAPLKVADASQTSSDLHKKTAASMPKQTDAGKQGGVVLLDGGAAGGLDSADGPILDEIGAEQMVNNVALTTASDLDKKDSVALIDSGAHGHAVGGGSEVSSGDAVLDEVSKSNAVLDETISKQQSSSESTAESSADASKPEMLDDITSEQMVDNVALDVNGAS